MLLHVVLSAGLLNDAIESLGIPGIRFDEVDGRPLLRKSYDEMSLDGFIGLLLKGIAEIHLRRLRDARRLGEFDEALQRLSAQGFDGESGITLATESASLVRDLRRSLTESVLVGSTESPSTRLTIGRDD
jgi:hypothetical protein